MGMTSGFHCPVASVFQLISIPNTFLENFLKWQVLREGRMFPNLCYGRDSWAAQAGFQSVFTVVSSRLYTGYGWLMGKASTSVFR